MLIADIVLQLLSYVAQTEREFNHQRQAEGIAAARKRGVRFGRPHVPPPHDFPTIVVEWESGQLSFCEVLARSGLSEAAFYRRLKEFRLVVK